MHAHINVKLLVFIYSLVYADDGGWFTDEDKLIAFPGPCTVEVRDAKDLTQEEFLSRYAFRQPLVIRSSADNTDFINSCRKETMLKKYATKRIRLSSANTYSYLKVDVTLAEYVEKILKPQTLEMLGNETLYWFGDNNYTEWQTLLDKYIPPSYSLPDMTGVFSFGLADVDESTVSLSLTWQLFSCVGYALDHVMPVSSQKEEGRTCASAYDATLRKVTDDKLPDGAGTGVPFHFHGPGFGEVIFGRKRWFLLPPEKMPYFHPNRTTLQWLFEEYPKLHPSDLPLECTLNPGEIIYFPDRWWHGTLNIDTSVFISTFLG